VIHQETEEKIVFGVPCLRPIVGEPSSPDAEETLQMARTAAEELVAELERARQITRQWADEELTGLLVEAALSASLHRLAQTGLWGEANQIPSSAFWQIAGPCLEVGVLQRHARLKPHGYAGDYQMLHWIATDYCCPDPLGKAFDRYFQRQAAPQAVRSRTRQTAAAIVAHRLQSAGANYHVVSVGSGPALDVYQALAQLPQQYRGGLQATLLDLDPHALEFSAAKLGALLPPGDLHCIRENLYRLPKNRRAEQILGVPHVLICTGLFDYLDDRTAAAMLRLFWDRLAVGGLLLVGNFAPQQPTRAYMEWIGNWYLTYRTADDLERLSGAAGIARQQCALASDALGVDLFLIARK
jgi:hypothetical protein